MSTEVVPSESQTSLCCGSRANDFGFLSSRHQKELRLANLGRTKYLKIHEDNTVAESPTSQTQQQVSDPIMG